MNTVYNASAGTGKTYQLTSLYAELVLGGETIDPRDILLMTFTDNAAAELQQRVAQRIMKTRRTAEAADNDPLAERARLALLRLPAAPIGTIHSYCTRLLREHALEAGLSPSFSVLAGDERDELLDQICRDELLARLLSDSDFTAFCSGAQIIGGGNGFGASITETVPSLILQAGSLGISLEQAETMLPDPLPPVTIHAFREIHEQLSALPKRPKKAEEACQLLGECLRKTSDPAVLIGLFEASFSGHFTYGDAKEISRAFTELKKEVTERLLYRARLPAARAFARYVQAVARQFQQRKHAMDAVDFDDLLRMAAELLQSGQAAPAFSYVIVDEVQDTSRIQCDIIRKLWGPDTRLVICGDRKQSIYAWRGADPQVMPDLEAAIRSRGDCETIPLQTSYRSKAPIIAVVNRIFAAVYGDEDYHPADRLQPNAAFQTQGEKPCVEFLAPDGESGEWSKEETIAAEMQAVAGRIRLLVSGSRDWQPAYRYADGFRPVAEDNAFRYSDILILLRRTSHQPALEHALRQAGIPYTLGGKGRGLFTRQETRDVSLFLNAVTNPSDVLSLVGFLRSPWVGLSDEAIAELSWSADGFSAEALRKNYAAKTDRIDRGRALLGTRLASELVRMLIDETGFDALQAGLPRGTQRLANLRKVIDWLRENERGGQTTPAAVARKLAEQISNPPGVPEAALPDPAQNAVTIMTVHGAKGLTRRVVFVPDISFRSDSDRDFARVFFDSAGVPRMGLKITAPDKSAVLSPGFDAARRRWTEVRNHELKNLFYVAMTRARDLVVVSASVGRSPENWRKELDPFIVSGDLPSIPYSAIRAAAGLPAAAANAPPTAAGLAAALEGLLPPPDRPRLRRMPATRLARQSDELEELFEEDADRTGRRTAEKAAALGSLGHAVLEQLALNGWEGAAGDWLDKLRDEFGVGKRDAGRLGGRIGQTCALMRNLTDGMPELLPEFPFLLHADDLLIDGTIDLLCRTPDGCAIYDYKFTEATDGEAAESYRAQMEIYRKAAAKAFPEAGRTEVTLVVVSAAGPRLVPVA